MNIWTKSLLISAATAILMGFAFTHRSLKEMVKKFSVYYKIGIDTTGKGSNKTLGAETYSKLRSRLEQSQYLFEIKKDSGHTIGIAFHHITDTLDTRDLLTLQGKVEFRELYKLAEMKAALLVAKELGDKMFPGPNDEFPSHTPEEKISKEVRDLLDTMNLNNEKEQNSSWGLASLIRISPSTETEDGTIESPSTIGTVKLKDTDVVGRIFRSERVLQSAPPGLELYFGRSNRGYQTQHEESFVLYGIRPDNMNADSLRNEDIKEAKRDFGSNFTYAVKIRFTHAGSAKWTNMTRKNAGRSIAILVDKNVVSAPSIDKVIESDIIILTSNMTSHQCQTLAIQLGNAPLPANIHIVNTKINLEKDPFILRRFLTILMLFVLVAGLALFIFKTLKST